MNKIVFLVALLSLIEGCNLRNSSKNDMQIAMSKEKEIMDCNVLIGQPLRAENEVEREYNMKLEFVTFESYKYDINNDGKNETIILEKLKDWNDPGDYHRIKIIGDSIYTFFNVHGWVKSSSGDEYVPNIDSLSLIHSNYVIVSRNNADLLLFAFGYIYASQPGLLTIINLSIEKPKLILNDNCLLSKYQDANPKITVTKYFKQYNLNQHDTLLLKNHCFEILYEAERIQL